MNSNFSSGMYEELWRACAGPLVHLPQCGERVLYFPQGHLEQVAASSNRKLSEVLPTNFDLPPKILCRVINITLLSGDADEVYSQIALHPELNQGEVTNPEPTLPDLPKPIVQSFCKALTATDISNKLHVRVQDAQECFPSLDTTLESPSQELVAKDMDGYTWPFKHVYGGNPKRHLLSTGWKRFVTAKRLVAGDAVIFLRGENGDIWVGTRHLISQRRYMPRHFNYYTSDESTDLLAEILVTARYGLSTGSIFTVFYHPSLGSSPFIVGANRYMECSKNLCSTGLRFSMRFEGGDYLQRRCTGSIVGVGDVSSNWTNSKWRCLKVKWDDDHGTIIRPERVSPWEIDPVDLNKEPRFVQSNRRLGKPNQARKTRQPKPIHHSSAEENTMMNSTPNFPNEQNWCLESAVQLIQQQEHTENWLFDPLISSQQQYWIPNVGQPNWTSLQTSSIHDGPIFSNGDNWILQMLHDEPLQLDEFVCNQFPTVSPAIHFSQLHGERVSILNSEDSVLGETRIQQLLHDEPLQLDEIVCNQFPTVSPTIHFSQLHGERVSTLNSEETVQGQTKKRKATSVGDAESGNAKEPEFDDRQVKCRIEPSQGSADSNSNGTHYSSVSEGEPSAGKGSQYSTTMVEDTENASDRPFVYRAWDRISGFLLHHLKNYVTK